MNLIARIVIAVMFLTALLLAQMQAQTFRGTLPCADCSGVDTQLTLFPNGHYRMTATYLGRKSHYSQSGAWTTVHGMPGNPDATLYQLDPGKPNAASYLRVSDDELTQLDHEQHIIQAGPKMNFSLRRVQPGQAPKAGLANPASVNCAQKGGKLEMHKNANGGAYGMCVFANGKQCEEWALFRKTCSVE